MSNRPRRKHKFCARKIFQRVSTILLVTTALQPGIEKGFFFFFLVFLCLISFFVAFPGCFQDKTKLISKTSSSNCPSLVFLSGFFCRVSHFSLVVFKPKKRQIATRKGYMETSLNGKQSVSLIQFKSSPSLLM